MNLYLANKLYEVYLFRFALFQCRMFNKIEDTALQQLLPQMIDLLVGSSAVNTVVKCNAGRKKWKVWAGSKLGIVALPAFPLQAALYLTEQVKHASDNGHPVAVIKAAAYSIRWGHRMVGTSSPTDHPLVKSVIEGAKRKLATLIQLKDPLSKKVVTEITNSITRMHL